MMKEDQTYYLIRKRFKIPDGMKFDNDRCFTINNGWATFPPKKMLSYCIFQVLKKLMSLLRKTKKKIIGRFL